MIDDDAVDLKTMGGRFPDFVVPEGEYHVIVRDGDAAQTLEGLEPVGAPPTVQVRF